jgi:hypothetical protein
MPLEERPTALVFFPASLFFGASALVVGSLTARIRSGPLLRPVLRALLLLDAHLKEPALLLTEFDDCGSGVLTFVIASASFQLRARIGFGSRRSV